MTTGMDTSNTDDYYVTALQIFDYCGADGSSSLRVDTLMDKFAPFIKTNKAEYSHLKSILDPEQDNPEINVTKLAMALNKYSESQKAKVDLDESFNLLCGKAPQDSDSGISSDGFQLLEELQCELREKSRLAQQLRSQLDYSERQHEEALAALTAERDSLRAHLNILREENASLVDVRHDYDEACERLTVAERQLGDARREHESLRRHCSVAAERAAAAESRKTTLQELLNKSKEDCHRINEMYANRQSALLEQNETLKTERSELAAKLQDQDEFLQQLIKDKVLLEMELKDMLNKSNQTHLRLDRSIDVSYTEDQMLTALESLNDARFSQDNHVLDEESFIRALKEEHQGRSTNMSLFDEIRLSFGHNISKPNFIDSPDTSFKFRDLDKSFLDIQTQTDDIEVSVDSNKVSFTIETQTSTDICNLTETRHVERQDTENNNTSNVCKDCTSCIECDKLKIYIDKLESDAKRMREVIKDTESDLSKNEENLNVLQKIVNDGNGRNSFLQVAVDSLRSKIELLEKACANQRDIIDGFSCEMCCVECQTDADVASVSTQAELPCVDCIKHVSPHRGLRKYLWGPLRSMLHLLAAVCFTCALWVLYNVTVRRARCRPNGWLYAEDLFDMLLKIEQFNDVPM